MKLLLVDGNNIVNRAFYGIRALSNKKGMATNAVYGFMNTYDHAMKKVKADCVAVAFDVREPTFRHKAVDTYKATRKPMPDELAMQIPVLKKLLNAMGIPTVEVPGYEADDVIGTLSAACNASGTECVILSGDKDNLQLINKNTKVFFVTNKKDILYDTQRFFDEYGFMPEGIVDYKALMGDSSDNIKGVDGIGKVRALELIREWGTVEKLYDNIDTAKLTDSVRTKLKAGMQDAKQSKWLATIVTDVPVECKASAYKLKAMDKPELRRILTELEMFGYLSKLGLTPALPAENETVFQEENETELPTFDIENFDFLKDLETVDFGFEDSFVLIITKTALYTTDREELILQFFEHPIKKRVHHAKEAYRFAFERNGKLNNLCFDAIVAAYLIGENVRDIKDRHFTSFCDGLEKALEETGTRKLFYEMELPLIEVLATMEYYGVKVDLDGIKEFGEQLSIKIKQTEQNIYRLAGNQPQMSLLQPETDKSADEFVFNISSPKQLGEVLFDRLGLPAKKKTKTGRSTDADVLENLRDKHPIVGEILDYRQYSKLNSTYVTGLLKTVSPDGRIHTDFKQTETRTGRLSSAEPNLQNIPVRTELGRNMRKFFTADSGKVLIDADYNQIELRILAHLSQDENLTAAFINGEDIHAATAAGVFGLPTDMITSEMRSYAKAINFGIMYGMGAFSLAKEINAPLYKAKEYIEEYFTRFQSVRNFLEDMENQAKTDKYVTTMYGRRRYIPELASSNKTVQAAGMRIARNTPIQGSAADIIKIAMVKVCNRLKNENTDARLVLQIHDELIVEADKSCAEYAAKILKQEMENAARLRVPLEVSVNIGESWYEAKG